MPIRPTADPQRTPPERRPPAIAHDPYFPPRAERAAGGPSRRPDRVAHVHFDPHFPVRPKTSA
ncbi:hypothetical protein OPKNFCMD_0482 [Methylobacterium crusticola]|uniref:Uncharacterized protein n=1 Tax=Methylobacterium crusticola TaxID=1697972 RepID=A0ABQ4QR47_9HYPH|nr:hypothetical protein [Methylobacterium crusticola]GJD47772.1 hypothetical protein OPKNFCMD_0482 [Methylobacterium crusticola]